MLDIDDDYDYNYNFFDNFFDNNFEHNFFDDHLSHDYHGNFCAEHATEHDDNYDNFFDNNFFDDHIDDQSAPRCLLLPVRLLQLRSGRGRARSVPSALLDSRASPWYDDHAHRLHPRSRLLFLRAPARLSVLPRMRGARSVVPVLGELRRGPRASVIPRGLLRVSHRQLLDDNDFDFDDDNFDDDFFDYHGNNGCTRLRVLRLRMHPYRLWKSLQPPLQCEQYSGVQLRELHLPPQWYYLRFRSALQGGESGLHPIWLDGRKFVVSLLPHSGRGQLQYLR